MNMIIYRRRRRSFIYLNAIKIKKRLSIKDGKIEKVDHINEEMMGPQEVKPIWHRNCDIF